VVSDSSSPVFVEDRVDDDPRETSDESGLPAGWARSRVRDVTSLTRKPKGFKSTTEFIPFIPMAQIPESSLFISDWELRKPSEVKSGTFIRDGDVLLAKITPCLENGKQGIVRGLPSGWGYATTEVFPLQSSDRLDPEYLNAFLKESSVRRFLAARMEGTTGRQRLPKFVLEELEIALPPLPEQRAIAHVLRTVQQAREATEQIIEATRELKRSLMRHLFAYGPVPIDESDKVPFKGTRIGSVPEHWQVEVIGNVANKVGSGSTPRGGREAYVEEGYPLLRSQNVLMNRIRLDDVARIPPETHQRMSRTVVYPGDVLLNITGASIGRVACLPPGFPESNVNQHVCRIRFSDDVDPGFAAYFLSTPIGQQQIRGFQFGSTRQGINFGQVKSIEMPLPPMHEQRNISAALAAADAKIEVEEQRRQSLSALFDSMLHYLMTGKVRVPTEERVEETEEVTA
jgi:type I restriction enzyme, S subunit